MDDELRRLFDQLTGPDDAAVAAECAAPLDVFETREGIEVVMDVPGVAAGDLSVVVAKNMLLIVGHKAPSGCEHGRDAAFHIAERTFGRFARGVRLSGAFDTGGAGASLRAGELRITLPRIEERRGRERRIPIRAD